MKAIVTYKRGSSNPVEEKMEVDFPLVPEWDDYEEQMVFYPSGLPASNIISIDVKPEDINENSLTVKNGDVSVKFSGISKEQLDEMEKEIEESLETEFHLTEQQEIEKHQRQSLVDKMKPFQIIANLEKEGYIVVHKKNVAKAIAEDRDTDFEKLYTRKEVFEMGWESFFHGLQSYGDFLAVEKDGRFKKWFDKTFPI